MVTLENVAMNLRVKRSVEWNFKDQDGDSGIGTIVGPIKDGWVGVRWDNGNWHMYPISSYHQSILGNLKEHTLYMA